MNFKRQEIGSWLLLTISRLLKQITITFDPNN